MAVPPYSRPALMATHSPALAPHQSKYIAYLLYCTNSFNSAVTGHRPCRIVLPRAELELTRADGISYSDQLEVPHARGASSNSMLASNGDRTEVTQICRQRKARRLRTASRASNMSIRGQVQLDANIKQPYRTRFKNTGVGGWVNELRLCKTVS